MSNIEYSLRDLPRPNNLLTRALGLKPIQLFESKANGSYRITSDYVSSFAVPTENGSFILIDSGNDPKAQAIGFFLTKKYAHRGSGLEAVIHTHVHEDHTKGDQALLSKTDKFYVSGDGVDRYLGKSRSQGHLPALKDVFRQFVHLEPAAKNEGVKPIPVNDSQELQLPGLDVTFIKAPGHTDDSQVVVVKNNAGCHLYVGDALDFKANGQVKNAFLPVSHNYTQAMESIAWLPTKLEKLGIQPSDGLAVHPAHSGSGEWRSVLEFADKVGFIYQ